MEPVSTDFVWAIEPNAGRLLSQQGDMAAFRASGDQEPKPYQMYGTTAVIPLTGVMSKSGGWWSYNGGTVAVRNMIRMAVADASVDAIVLRIDSPGGTVSGTAELADDVFAASLVKPVVAFVDDMCCSAAFWVASQCSKVVANRTAIVGSIGTYMVVGDFSGMFEKEGIKVHLITTGSQKGAGSFGTQVTDEHLAGFQAMVDSLNAHFVAAVGAGRFDGDADKAAGVASGDVWVGQEAVSAGLVDSIGSLDDVLAELASAKRKGLGGARAARMTFESQIAGVLATARDLSSQAEALKARTVDIKALKEAEGRAVSASRMDELALVVSESVASIEDLAEAVGVLGLSAPAPEVDDDDALAALRLSLAM